MGVNGNNTDTSPHFLRYLKGEVDIHCCAMAKATVKKNKIHRGYTNYFKNRGITVCLKEARSFKNKTIHY